MNLTVSRILTAGGSGFGAANHDGFEDSFFYHPCCWLLSLCWSLHGYIFINMIPSVAFPCWHTLWKRRRWGLLSRLFTGEGKHIVYFYYLTAITGSHVTWNLYQIPMSPPPLLWRSTPCLRSKGKWIPESSGLSISKAEAVMAFVWWQCPLCPQI